MKPAFVTDLFAGDPVDELFALRKAEIKEFPNGRMLILELGDKTGRIKGVIWSAGAEQLKALKIGGIYRVKGNVTSYKGESQITVERIELCEKFDWDDFLARSGKSAEQLERQLDLAIESLSDADYKELLVLIFSGQSLKSAFINGIGGKLWHHNYIGGLAEHTLSIYGICCDFAARFDYLDRDLLLAGAILHDIGKAESYSFDGFFEYTDTGRLLGHIVIGEALVRDAINKISGFPKEKALKIRHLILSHQGSPEQSSPVHPMIPEGMALYIADLLDSQLAAMRRIKEKEHRPGVKWSNFVNLLDRHIYFGSESEAPEKPRLDRKNEQKNN